MSGLFLLILIYACLAFAAIGCFIGKFPSNVLSFLAVLFGFFTGQFCSGADLAIMAVLTVAAIFGSKFLVQQLKKKQEFSKSASWGTTIGSIIAMLIIIALSKTSMNGIVFFILALVFLVAIPFAGAFAFVYMSKKDTKIATEESTGATMVYLCSTFIKIIMVIVAFYLIFLQHARL